MRVLNPGRKSYKGTIKDKVCPFCESGQVIEIEGMGDRHWRVLANYYPYMDGNLMIVSRRHVENVSDLTDDEWVDFGRVLAQTKNVLGRVFKVNSYNFGMNHGPESGASVAHLHWQVLPRKAVNSGVVNTLFDTYLVTITAEESKRLIEKELGNSRVTRGNNQPTLTSRAK